MKQDSENFSWLDIPKTIWYFLEEDKARAVFYLSLLSFVLFYDLIPVYVVGKMVDFFTLYSAGQPLTTFYTYVIFLGVTYIIIAVVRIFGKQAVTIIGQKARARARMWGFERLTEFSLEWHNKENTGDKLQRIFTGADAIKKWMDTIREDILKSFAYIIGVLIVFIFYDAKLSLIVFIYSAIFLFVQFAFSKKLVMLSNEFNKLNQKASGVYVESASNMLAIKALGGEESVNTRVVNKEELSRDASIKRAKAGYNKWYFLNLISGISLVVFLFVMGKEVISHTITVGMILVLFTYFMRLRDSMGDLSALHNTLVDLRADLCQMMPIFRETEFIKTGNEIFPKDWQKIEIKNASMNYGSDQMGLSDFNLILRKDTKTGIAGLSGSGKSTLAKIMLGLYALKDGIFQIGEENYYSISHNEILSNMSVVLQETELFNLSLRDNITMMRGEDAELLKKAVEVAELGEVISRLPEGLDAMIGEKGYMLSGGERQRLGIARAIYKNAPIIILDEATSSLDSETEGKIMQKLLTEYGEGKTFLIIAHRLGTLKYTDNIAVMERGRVTEEGSYDQLMDNKSSVFYRLNKEKQNG